MSKIEIVKNGDGLVSVPLWPTLTIPVQTDLIEYMVKEGLEPTMAFRNQIEEFTIWLEKLHGMKSIEGYE